MYIAQEALQQIKVSAEVEHLNGRRQNHGCQHQQYSYPHTCSKAHDGSPSVGLLLSLLVLHHHIHGSHLLAEYLHEVLSSLYVGIVSRQQFVQFLVVYHRSILLFSSSLPLCSCFLTAASLCPVT